MTANTGTWQVQPDTANGDSGVIRVNYTPPPKPPRVPTAGLFEIVVYGPDRFDLIPKTDLAQFLAGAFMHGRTRVIAVGRGIAPPEDWTDDSKRATMDRLEFRFDPGPLLTKGGDPFFTGMSLRDGEYDIIRMALDRQRDQQSARKPRSKPKAAAKRAKKGA